MQLGTNQHLTYCTNIHPGKNWETSFKALQEHVPLIQKKISPTNPFGLGLRLSNQAAEELLSGAELSLFKRWLKENKVYIFTLNGFPYGDFHNTVVKENVHQPDWTTEARLRYTLNLFEILRELLPHGVEGGISTSPISYKHWYPTAEKKSKCMEQACANLARVVLRLARIESESGVYMHLDLEPEPDGILENTEDVLLFFETYAFPLISDYISQALGTSMGSALNTVKRHLTICYDACHFALAYERPSFTFSKLAQAGIVIGKVQLSSAVRAQFNASDRGAVWEALYGFREPVYLHQVTVQQEKGVFTYGDLDEVLEVKPEVAELRAHFHVPVYLRSMDFIGTTRDHLQAVLEYHNKYPVTNHLEIETYTWEVFPEVLKTGLSEMVIREFKWVLGNLQPDE